MKNKTKIIGLVLAMVILTTITVSAMYSNSTNCDINGDKQVYAYDYVYTVYNYGDYEYQHRCDYNRDFSVNNTDLRILKSKTRYLPGQYSSCNGVFLPNGIELCIYNLNNVVNWGNNWCTVSNHIYTTPYYTCGHFAVDFRESYEKDYGTTALWVTCSGIHFYTVIYKGGDPFIRSSWKKVTDNDNVRNDFISLDSSFLMGSDVCIKFGTPSLYQPEIRFDANEMVGYWYNW